MATINIKLTIPNEKVTQVRTSLQKVLPTVGEETPKEYLTRIVNHYLWSVYRAGYAQMMADGVEATDLEISNEPD
jgi:hypothetical protein